MSCLLQVKLDSTEGRYHMLYTYLDSSAVWHALHRTLFVYIFKIFRGRYWSSQKYLGLLYVGECILNASLTLQMIQRSIILILTITSTIYQIWFFFAWDFYLTNHQHFDFLMNNSWFASVLTNEYWNLYVLPVSASLLVSSSEDDYFRCESVVRNWADASSERGIKEDELTLKDILFFLHVPRTGGRTYFHWSVPLLLFSWYLGSYHTLAFTELCFWYSFNCLQLFEKNLYECSRMPTFLW